MSIRWSREDEIFLKNNYYSLTAKECSERLGRSYGAVFKKVGDLHIPSKYKQCWNSAQEKFLIDNYVKLGVAKCAQLLGKTPTSVSGRVNKLKINTRKDIKKRTVEKLDALLAKRGDRRLSEYVNGHVKIEIECKRHHKYLSVPGNIVTLNRGCPHCAKHVKEAMVRAIFENVFGVPFNTTRPAWLVNPETNCKMEIDGLNMGIGIGFEYQGRQHDSIMWYDKDSDRLNNLKKRDELKVGLCKKNGVKLIRINNFWKVFSLKSIASTVLKTIVDNDVNIDNKNIDINKIIDSMVTVKDSVNVDSRKYMYKEASMIAQRLRIENKQDYKIKCKRDSRLPADPLGCYRHKGWISWLCFLGQTRYNLYNSYRDAKQAVLKLKILSLHDYRKEHKRDLKLPSTPYMAYKNLGWVSWFRFLGNVKEPVVKINLLETC